MPSGPLSDPGDDFYADEGEGEEETEMDFCLTCGGPTQQDDREDIVLAVIDKGHLDLAEELASCWWDDAPRRVREALMAVAPAARPEGA